MPYEHTAGLPDLARALTEGHPKHCTRKPRKAKKHAHKHLPASVFSRARTVLSTRDETHGSDNTLYKLATSHSNNCIVLPITDPRVFIAYESGGPRQSARPYILKSTLSPNEELTIWTTYAKQAHKNNKLHMNTLVPEEAAIAELSGKPGPYGDVIAHWNKTIANGDAPGAKALLERLRSGARVVYTYNKPF